MREEGFSQDGYEEHISAKHNCLSDYNYNILFNTHNYKTKMVLVQNFQLSKTCTKKLSEY